MSESASSAEPPAEWPRLGDPGMLERIVDVIVREGKVERAAVTPEATLETLGLESVEVVMILMGLEEEFGVYIPMDTELSAARNLSELIAVIAGAMQADPPAGTSAGA